jgi:hypothetical protein
VETLRSVNKRVESKVHRSRFLAVATAVSLLGVARAHRPMTTYRDTGCGCCESWVKLAREAGYSVELHDLDRSERLRRFHLSDSSAGCHTTVVDGYLVEGHVPLDVVARLLRERPKTRGITIPGMPTGIAGMGGIPQPTAVLTLDSQPRVFARV